MTDSRQHQQATGRTPLSRSNRWRNALLAPVLRGLIRLLLGSCKIQTVRGSEHLDTLIEAGTPALLCCWHQRLAYCVNYLLGRRRDGLQPGFLVSPSRDGELIATIVGGLGAEVLRGSANRTGARALRDMYATLKAGVSPIIHPDCPHGPSGQAKPGSLMLAQMTRAFVLPMSFSASRYWQLGSWDRLIIPKPFSRITLVVGEPITVARGDDVDARASVLTERLNALDAEADRLAAASPRPGRR